MVYCVRRTLFRGAALEASAQCGETGVPCHERTSCWYECVYACTASVSCCLVAFAEIEYCCCLCTAAGATTSEYWYTRVRNDIDCVQSLCTQAFPRQCGVAIGASSPPGASGAAVRGRLEWYATFDPVWTALRPRTIKQKCEERRLAQLDALRAFDAQIKLMADTMQNQEKVLGQFPVPL